MTYSVVLCDNSSDMPEAPLFTRASPSSAATVGLLYDAYEFGATGNPAPSFELAAGTLPPGLTLLDGMLAGTPRTEGTFSFVVGATNNTRPDDLSRIIEIKVVPPAGPIFIADSPPSTAVVGSLYNYDFAATGAPAPTFHVETGGLPDGLNLLPGGRLAGCPTSVGKYAFTVKASNGTNPDRSSGVITIEVSNRSIRHVVGHALALPSNDTVKDHADTNYFNGQPFSNSKTQAIQDLIGIVAAIGLGFGLLTLIAGDQTKMPKSGSPSLINNLMSFFHLASPSTHLFHPVVDFVLLCVTTLRFYLLNIRYLANRYGDPDQDKTDWLRFTVIDFPAITIVGLLFAGMGLLVNNAFLFMLLLGLGLGVDAFWNLSLQILRWLNIWEGSRWDRANTTRLPRGSRKSWFSLMNNGIASLCIAAVAGYARIGFSKVHPFQLSQVGYWTFTLLVLLGSAISVFGYNKDLLVDPHK